MKNHQLVLWRDVPIKYRAKELHVRKSGGNFRRAFAVFYGELPFVTLKEHGDVEEVVNPRGNAYACRKRLKYRKNKKREAKPSY